MPLPELPTIERLTLAVVTAVPPEHPEYDTFEPFPVHGWVIRHPGGALLVDTGIGIGNHWIDEAYRPRTTALTDALASVALAPSDICAVVLSHLHFDHCGQHALLDAPVHVQAIEHEAAAEPGFTVPEWAAIPERRLRLAGGDEEVADGVRLLATPGHTPGHQSVVIEGGGRRVVLAAQCAFRAAELRSGQPSAANLHDPSLAEVARHSLHRLRALAPTAVHLSHDTEIVALTR